MATSNEYSNDLRLKIIEAYENKEGTQAQIASDFRVGKATVERLWSLYQETGSIAPRSHGGGNTPRMGPDELLVIQKIVQKRPDATIQEIGVVFDDVTCEWESQLNYKKPTSSSVISRTLAKLGLTLKKKSNGSRKRNA